jgi:hypothetical protein
MAVELADRSSSEIDRMSDDVLRLTGKRPLSAQEFVRKNSATFTSANEG